MLAPEPFFTPRGTPFSILHRLKTLSQLEFEVDVVTYPFGEDPHIPGVKIIRASRPFWIRSVRIGPSLAKIFLDFALYRTAKRLIKENKYDLIHTHEEASLIGAWWRIRYRIPHLYDMHSLLSQQMYNFKVPLAPLWAAIWKKFEDYVFHRVDAVIAICEDLGNTVRERYPDVSCRVIENQGIAEYVESVKEEHIQLMRKRFRWPDRIIFGYVGTFRPYQGIDLLLESIRVFKETYPHLIDRAGWVLVGVTEDERKTWTSLLHEHHIDDCVELWERISPEEAGIFQKAVDVLVSTRRYGTNVPLKIYSYLASGTPILATRLPTHTQVLSDEIALLVDPDAHALAEAYAWFIEHPHERKALGERARAHFQRHFSPSAFREKTLAILKDAFEHFRSSSNNRA